ncbi:transporter [[Eubacterium] hominis]|uniref:transporter n=1 Tax=[Eubacterium] hominis TaxID=2764325 RepID=UPI003A4D5A48
MAKSKKKHVDNLYQIKKLDTEYNHAFQRVYDALMKSQKSDADINIIANIAIQQCLDGMHDEKKATMVIPKDVKEYINKYSKGPVFKEMKKKIRNQDYEKFQIGSIWSVFAICIVLFFFKNLLMQEFLINYIVDVVVACFAGAIAFQNFLIKRRIIQRYEFGNFYTQLDVITLIACIFIKVISPGNFDITYLILVISFFVTKKKIKPQFEAVI